MLISSVIGSLEHDARMAMAVAETTPDYREVVVSIERARRLRAMAEAVRQVASADVLAPASTAIVVPMRRRSGAKVAATAPKPAKVGAWEFWRMHGQAVDAVRAVYGDAWKIRAPFGDTVLATVASGWKSAKTERGTVVKWPADGRMPAAKYWPGGEFPAGLVIAADYARVAGGCIRKLARSRFRSGMRWRRDMERGSDIWLEYTKHAHKALAEMRALPASTVTPTVEHGDAWHHARGYTWDGLKWVSELGDRASRAHALAIEDNRAAARVAALEAACPEYGPQPLQSFADIDDDLDLAEAAD